MSEESVFHTFGSSAGQVDLTPGWREGWAVVRHPQRGLGLRRVDAMRCVEEGWEWQRTDAAMMARIRHGRAPHHVATRLALESMAPAAAQRVASAVSCDDDPYGWDMLVIPAPSLDPDAPFPSPFPATFTDRDDVGDDLYRVLGVNVDMFSCPDRVHVGAVSGLSAAAGDRPNPLGWLFYGGSELFGTVVVLRDDHQPVDRAVIEFADAMYGALNARAMSASGAWLVHGYPFWRGRAQ